MKTLLIVLLMLLATSASAGCVLYQGGVEKPCRRLYSQTAKQYERASTV